MVKRLQVKNILPKKINKFGKIFPAENFRRKNFRRKIFRRKISGEIKGDLMNLTVTSEVLGPLTLSFQLLHRNLPKNRYFNHFFDVQYLFVAQFLLKLQAKTSKNDISICHDFVKKKDVKMLHANFNVICLQNGSNKTKT